VLSGAGQVLCAASPKAGAWFLLAFALFSPEAALGAVLGLVVATVMARGLGWNELLLGQGLFGYNAAMLGLAWAAFFPPPSPGFLLVLPAAAVATWLHGRLLPPFARRELPVLGVPFVLVVWGVGLLCVALGVGQLAPIIPPAIAGPGAGWTTPALRAAAASFAVTSLPGAAAAAIGLWCVSRAALGVALAGLTLGLGRLKAAKHLGLRERAGWDEVGLVEGVRDRGGRIAVPLERRDDLAVVEALGAKRPDLLDWRGESRRHAGPTPSLYLKFLAAGASRIPSAPRNQGSARRR